MTVDHWQSSSRVDLNQLFPDNRVAAKPAAAAAFSSMNAETCWLTDREMPAWDGFVSSHPHATIYHLSGWRRFVEETFPHIRGGVLVLRNRASGDLLAGIPLYAVKSLVLGSRVVSIPFATLGGALVSEPWQWDSLLPAMLEHLGKTGFRRLELRGARPSLTMEDSPLVPAAVHLHHYVQLPKSTAELRRGFSRTVRREISKAEKSGIEVREDQSAETRTVFSAMYQQARRRLGLPVYSDRFVEALSRHLPDSSVSFLVASRSGTTLGILLSLEFGDWAIAEQIAVAPEGRDLGVSHALFSHGMERAIHAGRRIYSFGRTTPGDAGLIQFKRAWGTIEEEITTLVFPAFKGRTGSPVRSLIGSLARFAFRTLPAPLARFSGKVFHRHWA